MLGVTLAVPSDVARRDRPPTRQRVKGKEWRGTTNERNHGGPNRIEQKRHRGCNTDKRVDAARGECHYPDLSAGGKRGLKENNRRKEATRTESIQSGSGTSGVIFARLLKLPNVTKPDSAAGNGATDGASTAGV